MDIQRVISGVLGFPLVLIIFLLGNKIVVDIALAIIALLSMNEYFNAVKKIAKPVYWIGYVSCFSIAFIHIVPEQYLNMVVTLSVPTILIILFAQVIATDMKTTFKDIAYTFVGIFYVVFFIMFVAFINGMPNGNILIWYAILAAWGTDISAYMVGKYLGKHKFSKVSPKKSIEGCIGGVIGAIILMIGYTYVANTCWGMNYSYWFIIGIGTILSLVGQIGDFAASSIKRFVDIKDYSNLIPGHGGMLDRIDSLIFLAPFAYALFTLL
ncbi:MAG: phosphatidate cytidylyltransferase [Clostridia bacterium]|nr:phosphatidate cytidylyltransferase [Clostridia bacterium]